MTPDGYIVREARYEHIAEIAALGARLPELDVGGVAGGFPKAKDIRSGSGGQLWLVATTIEGEVVGYCHASTRDADRSTGACLIYLAVDSGHRRLGIGEKLATDMLTWLRARGIDHVYAWANPDTGVIRLLRRAGFEQGKCCVWMDRNL